MKIGNVLKHNNFYAMVTAIEHQPSVRCHIAMNGAWYNDEEIAEWEKVEQ